MAIITNVVLANITAITKNIEKNANPTKIGQCIILCKTIDNTIVAKIIAKNISRVITISPFVF